ISATQIGFLIRANNASRKSADAADLSARAAIALQLPLIRIQPDKLGLGVHDKTERCSVSFVEIINRGKTRAFPKEVLYGWTVGDSLPDKPSYQALEKFALNSLIEPDAPNPLRQFLTCDHPLESGQRANICRGNYLWFYCDLIYDDFMGETRHHAFCWRWAYVGMGVGWR